MTPTRSPVSAMFRIIIHLLSGDTVKFEHSARSGGSDSLKIAYEGNFVIVTDEGGKQIAFPSERISFLEATPLTRAAIKAVEGE